MNNSGIVTKEEQQLLKDIVKNYPITHEWMKERARGGCICLSKVLHIYPKEIQALMINEGNQNYESN